MPNIIDAFRDANAFAYVHKSEKAKKMADGHIRRYREKVKSKRYHEDRVRHYENLLLYWIRVRTILEDL